MLINLRKDTTKIPLKCQKRRNKHTQDALIFTFSAISGSFSMMQTSYSALRRRLIPMAGRSCNSHRIWRDNAPANDFMLHNKKHRPDRDAACAGNTAGSGRR